MIAGQRGGGEANFGWKSFCLLLARADFWVGGVGWEISGVGWWTTGAVGNCSLRRVAATSTIFFLV
jgi:hypothetical protein